VKPSTNNPAEKRRKEIERQKWQREKAERKQQRQQERQERGGANPDEDPDLVGIVPGPQPTEAELTQSPPSGTDDPTRQ
jgi:hypothetical protein